MEELKKQYAQKFKKLFPNYRNVANEWYFDSKIDINKSNEFKKYGLGIGDIPIADGASYKENTLYSDIILIGKVVELITKGNDFTHSYKFEIERVIKGLEVIESVY